MQRISLNSSSIYHALLYYDIEDATKDNTDICFEPERAGISFKNYLLIASGGWLSFENLILLIELERYYANMFLPGTTSAPEVKFVHGFSTMPQKPVLLVDLVMIRGTSYLVLL